MAQSKATFHLLPTDNLFKNGYYYPCFSGVEEPALLRVESSGVVDSVSKAAEDFFYGAESISPITRHSFRAQERGEREGGRESRRALDPSTSPPKLLPWPLETFDAKRHDPLLFLSSLAFRMTSQTSASLTGHLQTGLGFKAAVPLSPRSPAGGHCPRLRVCWDSRSSYLLSA